jgi:CubicO group peptidase (beta-lactamase class C family)
MRTFVAFFLLFSISIANGQPPAFKKQLPAVDPYVQKMMTEWEIAGSAVAVVYKDKVIFSKGYGYSDVEKKTPVTTKTMFGIASNTKLFTGMAAAILHEEKKLDLDKPVRTYMPELRFATGELDEKLTLRDMLSHRSGVPRWDGVWAGSDYSLQDILDRLQYMKPTLGFRQGYLYNNNMYATAGAITAKVNGTTWEQLIQTRIFDPLEMKASTFSFEDAARKGDFSKDYLVGKVDKKLKEYAPDTHCDCWAPAANIVSNVDDLSNWIITQINGGKFKGKQVIPAKAITETMIPNNITSKEMIYDELFYGLYGLGRSTTDYKGHILVSHTGVISGYRSTVTMLPKDSLGVIVLTNTAQGSPMANATVYGIVDRLLQLDQSPWTAKIKAEMTKQEKKSLREADSLKALKVKDTKPSHALADYVGTFEHKAYGKIVISVDGDHLRMKHRIWDEALEHFHYDQFWSTEYPDASINYSLRVYKLHFMTNEAGKIDKIRTRVGGDPEVEFVRMKEPGGTTPAASQSR